MSDAPDTSSSTDVPARGTFIRPSLRLSASLRNTWGRALDAKTTTGMSSTGPAAAAADPAAPPPSALATFFAEIDAGPLVLPAMDAEADGDGTGASGDPYDPSTYSGKAVPVGGGEVLDVPIPVTAADSVVTYEVTTGKYDVGFGVYAERMEEEMVVKETSRVGSHKEAVTGKFLVQSVPCMLVFAFDNSYSWMREKQVTYTITVTPPAEEHHKAERRRRAEAALAAVETDLAELGAVATDARQRRDLLDAEIRALQAKVEQGLAELETAAGEEEAAEGKIVAGSAKKEGLETRLAGEFQDEAAGKPSGWW